MEESQLLLHFPKTPGPIDGQSEVPEPPGAEFAHGTCESSLYFTAQWRCLYVAIETPAFPVPHPSVIPEINGDKDPWDTGLKAAAGLQIPSL